MRGFILGAVVTAMIVLVVNAQQDMDAGNKATVAKCASHGGTARQLHDGAEIVGVICRDGRGFAR